MGGIDKPQPKLTDEQIKARLIEIGRNAKVPNPHTVWYVQDPRPLSHELRDICYSLPVGHFEAFPIFPFHLFSGHMAFFTERQAAEEEAIKRLVRFGYRCFFCHGVAHPQTGCQYSETCLVCYNCTMEFAKWVQQFTHSKGIRRIRERHPNAPSFYEAAAKFLGQDHRKVSV